MAKPPPSTPHSDIDGVHQDEKRNTDVAHGLGQHAGTVAAAKKRNAGRPEEQEGGSREDRTR